MTVEFTYSFDDLKEAFAPEVPAQLRSKKQQSMRRNGLLGWVLFASIIVFLFVLLQRSTPPSAIPGNTPPPPPPPPTQDLMLMLAPHITVAGFLLMFYLARIAMPLKLPKPSKFQAGVREVLRQSCPRSCV